MAASEYPASLRVPVAGATTPARDTSPTGAERFRAAFENLGLGAAIADLEGRWLEVNDAVCRILGYERDELIGRRILDFTHPDDRARSRECMQALLDGACPHYSLEKRYRRKAGGVVWARITVALVRDAAGTPQTYVGAIQDIGAEKLAEAQRNALRDALELMAHDAPLPAVLSALVELVERCSPARVRGSILLLDAEGRLRHGAAPSLPDEYRRAIDGVAAGPDVGSCGAAAFLNERVEADDIAHDPRWSDFRDAALRHGLRACWSVPICSAQGRVVGTFAMYYDAPRTAAPQDLQLVQLVTRTAAIAIERARAQEVLRASEAKFAAAFGQSPLGLTITSLDTGKLIEVNQGLLDVTGFARDELIDRSPDEIGLWIEPEQRRERFRMLAEGRRPPDIEARFRIKDGSERVALVASSLIEVDRRPCVLTSVVDITDRKRAEHALRDSEARQRFLVELNGATQALTDPDRIMAVTAELLGRHLDADRCAYAEVEPDEDTVVITGDYIRGVPSMVGRTQLAFFGDAVCRMLRDGETVVIEDIDADARAPTDPFVYRATMIRAAIAVPLRKDGRLAAGMAVTHATPRRWRDEEVRLVELVVNRCWETIERARALRRLGESEARARLALDLAGQGTWTWDADGDSVEADARCREICGLPPGPLRRADVRARIHPSDADRVDAAMARALASGGDGTYAEEYRVVHPDGSERWVQSRGQVQAIGPARHARLMLGTMLDITERKRIEQELTNNDRRKDEFLAVLAHELRNPLAPLRNVLQVMRASRGPDTLVEMMERQVNHMVRLVDDLLEVSRISRGKIELKREPLDLGILLRQVVEAAAPLIEKAGHRLTVDVPDDALRLDADPVRLAQVFTNLLNNAVKFTPPGGRIDLSARGRDGEAIVAVRDSGVGIPGEMLGRIFEMFMQVDRSTHRTGGGLGIGLSLARNLVVLHGGRIEARSDGHGHGSEFVVHLPLSERIGAATPPPAPLSRAQPLPRVLVVDDNRDAADSLGMLLNFLGADVKVAHSGQAALDVFETHRPSLVLLDLGMPGMDGYEVARRVRERYGNAIRIVALSGWGYDEDRRRTASAGFDQHLIKPADAAALQSVLAAHAGAGTRPPKI